ncbi:MAG TPA: OmpA family protein [Polyangiales bacterium]|nr:OmpA family protein [Polyangiales bacterium]
MKLTHCNQVGASLLLAAAIGSGCASTPQPSKELIDAREVYARSEKGKAREYNPAALHEAKTALDKAEHAFKDDPGSDTARDEAYIALRRAERADIEGSTSAWQDRETKARDAAAQSQAKNLEKTQAELAVARQELAQEKIAREAADAKAKEVLAKLQAKEDERGTVITLSGNVLFASGKSALLPGAMTSLEQVAEAIRNQKDKKVLIEGHTDSRGTEAANQALSKARADSVGAYLSAHGVPSDRITTAGLGPSRPIADNKTPEGRANNRRVEIVLQNAPRTN